MAARRRFAAGVAALGWAVLAGCGTGTHFSSAPAPRPADVPVPRTSHVVVLVMENKEYTDVIGSPDAPFVNRLARRYALPRHFYGVAHPSLPNYLALTGGSTFGITSDCTDCRVHATNLVDQLDHAGISWKAYMEGMPHPCFKGSSARDYALRHDPFVYYDDVRRETPRCRRVVPATELRADLTSGGLPTFAWITPDVCDDTHDCSIATGDRYLSRLVPTLVRALGPRGVLVITWDEGDSDASCCGGLARGGRIPTIIVGPTVRRGARPTAAYSHYSTLATIELALGLPRLRAAGSAHTRPLDAAFVTPPRVR
jgi:hypothetical protein